MVAVAGLLVGWASIFPLGSFLIDPFLLAALGVLIVYVASSRPGVILALCAVTLGIFYACSISLYLDLAWIEWMWRLCGAASGRDWMLNSGVLGLDYTKVTVTTHVVAVVLFVLYPLWLYLGTRLGQALWSAKHAPSGLL